MDRQRRATKTNAFLGLEQLQQMRRGRAIATRLQHPLKQLLGRLSGLDVEQLSAVLGDNQTRLQFQQRRDQHDEFSGGLQVKLAATLEVIEVGEHDVGQLKVEQVHLLAQDEREQQVERPTEDLQVEVECGKRHASTVSIAPDGPCHRGVRELYRSLSSKMAMPPARAGGIAKIEQLTILASARARRTHAHTLTDLDKRADSDRARALRPVRKHPLQGVLVGAQLYVAIAHRREHL